MQPPPLTDSMLSYETPAQLPRPTLAVVLLATWGGLWILLGLGLTALIIVAYVAVGASSVGGHRPSIEPLAASLAYGLVALWGLALVIAAWRVARRSSGWAIAGLSMIGVQTGLCCLGLASMVFMWLLVIPRMSSSATSMPSGTLTIVLITMLAMYGVPALLSALTIWPLWRAVRMLYGGGRQGVASS